MTLPLSRRARRVAPALVLLAAFGIAPAFAQSGPAASLDPVVVTANRTPQPLSSVLADTSIVDRATIERSGDEKEDIRQLTSSFTKIVEDNVRRYPDQWLWIHKRWRTRPVGEQNFYESVE